MTLQEVKGLIAKDYGYESWYDIDPTNVSMDQVWKDVSILYARSKWSEAAFESFKLNIDSPLYTEPEFKP
jgi:hypothetical protein